MSKIFAWCLNNKMQIIRFLVIYLKMNHTVCSDFKFMDFSQGPFLSHKVSKRSPRPKLTLHTFAYMNTNGLIVFNFHEIDFIRYNFSHFKIFKFIFTLTKPDFVPAPKTLLIITILLKIFKLLK